MGRFPGQYNEVYATLIAARSAVRAAQMGVTPEQFFAGRMLKVQAEAVGGQKFDQGREVTNTAEFRNWFGDSKAVDAEGRPLVMYHGTAGDFEAFDPEKSRSDGTVGKAIYLTSSPQYAEEFARGAFGAQGAPSIVPLYANARNILDLADLVTDKDVSAMKEAGALSTAFTVDAPITHGQLFDFLAQREGSRDAAMEIYRSLGYDGVRFTKFGGGQDTLAVFAPEQVKSAVGNRGAFDPNDTNILHQSGATPTDTAMQRWKEALGKVSRERMDYAPSLDTPAVLREMGIKQGKLKLPTRVMLQIRTRHPDVPLELFENLPKLLANPIAIYPHADGGLRVIVDAVTDKGEPIAVGIGERIQTITPIHNEGGATGVQRVQAAWERAGKQRGVKLYLRNDEAPANAGASVGVPSATIALRRSPSSAATIVTRGKLVKKLGAEFYQTGSDPRGSFSPLQNLTTLLQGADPSTFLHEAAHYFFEDDIALASQLVNEARQFGYDSLKPGERQIVDDVSALLKWHGIEGDIEEQLRQWHTMDFEEQRSHHERTAESFEAYLFSGKSPSIELNSYFQRFRAFLIAAYTSLKDFLASNPEAGKLNDDVRAIFDRMLATSEEIALAEQGRSMMPLFASPEQAGMTPEEFAAYQALGIDATNVAIQELQAKGLRDMQWMANKRGKAIAKLQKQAKALRAEAMIEARREVMSQPVYRAWQFLTRRLTDNDKLPPLERKSDPDILDPSLDSLFVAIAKLGVWAAEAPI